MELLNDLISPLVLGTLLGGLYVVVALGLSLVFGVLKVINVAHGTLVILGSYVAYAFASVWGIDPILWLLLGIPLFFFLGILIEKYLLARAVSKSADAALIIAFGIALIIQNAAQIIWSPQSRSLLTDYSFNSFQVGDIYIPLVYILSFFAALIVMLVVRQFLKKTYMGQAITAASQNKGTAELMGINSKQVYQIAFGIAMAMAAIAGVFYGLTFPFNPVSGNALLIIAFGVVILGGLGSMAGTFIGGIIFGLSQTLGGYFFGPTGQLLVPFLMVLVVLTIRPQGLFGR
jgi:branched-chain amino acid transport system permease protein